MAVKLFEEQGAMRSSRGAQRGWQGGREEWGMRVSREGEGERLDRGEEGERWVGRGERGVGRRERGVGRRAASGVCQWVCTTWKKGTGTGRDWERFEGYVFTEKSGWSGHGIAKDRSIGQVLEERGLPVPA